MLTFYHYLIIIQYRCQKQVEICWNWKVLTMGDIATDYSVGVDWLREREREREIIIYIYIYITNGPIMQGEKV